VCALALLAAACGSSGGHRNPSGSGTTGSSDSTAPSAGGDAGIYAAAVGPGLSPAVQGVPLRVYVPNSLSNSVDVIDPATYRVVDHFAVGRVPQHVTPAWDLRTLFVDNTEGDSLTPVDPKTGKPGTPIPVTDPYNLYFTPDGTKAIVVAERFDRLDFRDPRSWQLIKSVPAPPYRQPCPDVGATDINGLDHLDFSADGSFFLLSSECSGRMFKVDVASLSFAGQVDVGGSPVDVKLSPDGKVFYVANQKRNGVSVVDTAALREVAFIPTGEGAHGLYPSRDGRSLYVANRAPRTHHGSVTVIDFATRKVTATWPVAGTPDMGGVTPDGAEFWLSGRYDDAVYVIDTKSGAVTHRIPVGKGPHGLAVFPQPGRFSLGHTGNYR
jgi:YVTN family beta-propeller protein